MNDKQEQPVSMEPWSTKEHFYRELDRLRQQMEDKAVVMRYPQYDVVLQVIASDYGKIVVAPHPTSRSEPVSMEPVAKVEVSYDEVICPNCVTQFRAIPVNVQQRIAELEAENKRLAKAWKAKDASAAKAVASEREVWNERETLRQLKANLERTNAVLLEALKYHQEQTRPIQRTIDAIEAAEVKP